MRVVAGTARGRRLHAPAGHDVRPTSDRVREAIFSSITSLEAIDGAVVVDLFAGTGALGIEALSRGAAHVTFVDHSPAAIAAIRSNLASTGLDDPSTTTVVRYDVARWLAGAGAPPHRIDLAFADPPYDFEGWQGLLDALDALDATVLMLESGRLVEVGERYEVRRQKRYGGTVVTIATRRDHDRDDGESTR